ncbi:MAG: Crp/Fnr family transcriptional regulator [Flavobacteriaceae bacterium]|nr:Crp/Fnr family transcriptional regulator [Flavobacteriaceae bacterium]
MNPYFKFLNEIGTISENTFKQLSNLSEFKKYSSKIQLAEAGKIPSKVFMLVSGVLRAYISLETGKQHNKRLYSAPSFAGALTSMIKNEPSIIALETLTDCEVIEIDYHGFKQLCENNIEINQLYAKVLELAFIAYEERNLDLMTLSATERYLKLKKQIPGIEDIIPQYQIASYLNITPVQLSRIRKSLK